MMIPDRSPEKVTIEDLLRIKRAERPPAEFWTRFEQDLRAKQLAAIVEKRPWWCYLRIPQVTRVVSRYQVPVGAAAILALSFIVAGQYRSVVTPSERLAPELAAPIAQVMAPLPVSPKVDSVVATVSASSLPDVMAVPTDARVASVPSSVEANPTALPPRLAGLTQMIPWGVSSSEDEAPADRLLTTGLQTDAPPAMSVATLLGNVRSDENSIEAKPSVSQATSPRELRRAKILTGMVLVANAEASDYSRAIQGRDIAANDLSEARLYDSVQRMGVGGDRFTLKF